MTRPEAHVGVDHFAEYEKPWGAWCKDGECNGAGWDMDADTHAEALAAALQHCRDYPRKEAQP